MFVELGDMYIEGLVPIFSLTDDHYTYRETTREIRGGKSNKVYRPGMKVRVLLDRIDRGNRRLQFAVLPDHATGEAAVPQGARDPSQSAPANRQSAAKRLQQPIRNGPQRTASQAHARRSAPSQKQRR